MPVCADNAGINEHHSKKSAEAAQVRGAQHLTLEEQSGKARDARDQDVKGRCLESWVNISKYLLRQESVSCHVVQDSG